MFPIGEQPDFMKDLDQIEVIALQGKTKNLERLKDFLNIGKLRLFTVNQIASCCDCI